MGEKLLEIGYTKTVKRLPQIVHYCSAVGGKGEGSFCCAFAWWESWEGENPRWRTMCFPTPTPNISARRQTFRLDARKCWELINLTMTLPKTMTSPKTTTHIFLSNFSNVSVSHVSKLPVIYLMLILLLEISGRPIQF